MTPNTKALGYALAGFLAATFHVQAAVTVDEYGWTNVTPSQDSRIIYVSNSEGDDTNDGYSPESPKKTIRNANNFLRNGYPDHMLLKRGDVFPMENNNLLLRWKSGRSQQEPMLMSYYGDSGPRPVIKIGDRFIDHDGGVGDFIAFIGLDIYRAVSDPASPDFDNRSGSTALRLVGGGKDFLMEDCILRFGSIVIQSHGEGNAYTNPKVRRNIVVDSWGHNSYLRQGGAQGIFLMYLQEGYTVEENFFDHCGWSEVVENAGANQYNHNMYIQYNNVAGGIIRGNIVARGAAHGIQARSGGLVDRNLFILNAIGLNTGGVAAPTDPDVLTFPNRVKENVIISGRMMDPDNSAEPRTAALFGIDATVHIPGVRIEDNIVANRIHNGSNAGIRQLGNPILVNNIVYKWDPNQDTTNPAWPHPDDDMGDYYASIGGQDDTIAYLEWLRTRPLRTFPWEMTAYAGINYIREGFNKDPVEGYYEYQTLSDSMWVDWPRDSEGYVNAEGWLGWLYVDGDWVYSYQTDGWMFLPEEAVTPGGAWGYIYR